jgi:hypothetical protein
MGLGGTIGIREARSYLFCVHVSTHHGIRVFGGRLARGKVDLHHSISSYTIKSDLKFSCGLLTERAWSVRRAVCLFSYLVGGAHEAFQSR